MNMNKFILSGNLTRDPEQIETSTGATFVILGVANNYEWRGEDGEKQSRASYFRLKTFGRAAKSHLQYLRKGSGILAEGRIEPTKYEKNEETVYGVDFNAEYVEYIDKKPVGAT